MQSPGLRNEYISQGHKSGKRGIWVQVHKIFPLFSGIPNIMGIFDPWVKRRASGLNGDLLNLTQKTFRAKKHFLWSSHHILWPCTAGWTFLLFLNSLFVYLCLHWVFITALGLYTVGLLYCGEQALLSGWEAQGSHCDGFSRCREQALGCMGFSSCSTQAQYLGHVGLVALQHVGI